MDVRAVWIKVGSATKSARSTAASGTVNALDALTPVCAPFAARWDAEADRRDKLRTPEHLRALMDAQRAVNATHAVAVQAQSQLQTAKAKSGALSGTRRAARAASRATQAQHAAAKKALQTARRDYPDTLTSVAVRAHAAHTVPATLASGVMSLADHDVTAWPVGMSAALIALHVGSLWLGRRAVATVAPDADGATAEELRLMERLDPSYWVQHTDARGLAGTLTERPRLTPAGIACGVRLDGRWSAKKLAGEADSVRALLGMRSDTRMDIGRGSHGDRAEILVRTRSASDGMSLVWTPDHSGIGVCEVTGDIVDIPLKAGIHVLLAGITGMGKSVSWRPLVMRAVASPDWTAIVLDPKRQEAIGWQHALRTVGQEPDREQRMDDIYGLIVELTREMHRRQGIATGSVWVPDGRPENRCLLVVIDEGAAIVRMAKEKAYKDVLTRLEELWSEARSVGFQFVWATQNPTKEAGVPPLVKDNMSVRMALTTGAGEHERSIFGESAQQTGWTPSRLNGIPGRALLQQGKRPADPIRLWHVTDETVAALPAEEPWRTPTGVPVPAPDPDGGPGGGPRLTLVKAPIGPAVSVPADVPAEAPADEVQLTESEARLLAALVAASGPQRHRDLVTATGMAKATVSKGLAGLTAHGLVVRDGQTYTATPAAGEVSA